MEKQNKQLNTDILEKKKVISKGNKKRKKCAQSNNKASYKNMWVELQATFVYNLESRNFIYKTIKNVNVWDNTISSILDQFEEVVKLNWVSICI